MYQGNAALSLEPWWEKPAANDACASGVRYANVDPVNNIDPTGNFSLGSLMASISVSSTLNVLSVGANGSARDYGYAASLGVLEGAVFYGAILKAYKAGKILVPIGKSLILSRQIQRIFKTTSNAGPLISGFKHLSFTFNLSTKAGKFFISSGSGATGSNGVSGALKHLVGNMVQKSGNAITTEFAEALVLTELKAAVEVAASGGIQFGKKMIVKTQGSTWEMIFEAPKTAGQLPKLFHMRKL